METFSVVTEEVKRGASHNYSGLCAPLAERGVPGSTRRSRPPDGVTRSFTLVISKYKDKHQWMLIFWILNE